MAVPVLFYAVDPDRPLVPPTWFKPVWFEAKDGWVRMPNQVGAGTPDIGIPKRTDAREWVVAPGEYDLPPFGPIEGTPQQWAQGTLYSDWIAGAYGPMRDCVACAAEMILGDRDTLVGREGKGMGAVVDFDDRDDWSASFDTGGSVPSPFSDCDSFTATPATGGSPGASFSDRDSLTVDPSTGGSPGASLNDRDAWTAEPATGGSPATSFGDRDTWTADGVVSSAPVPGASCAAAGTLSLGSSYTWTVPAMTTQWLSFPVVAGSNYRCRYVYVSGDSTLAVQLFHGSCPSPTSAGTLTLSGCAGFTAASGDVGYIRAIGGFISGTTFTVTPDNGNCP